MRPLHDHRTRMRRLSVFGLGVLLVVPFARAATPAALPALPALPAASLAQTPYPGVLQLSIDARDVERAILRGKLVLPVAGPGPQTIYFPRWVPGHHAPSGPISRIAGIVVRAAGTSIAWQRDPVMMHALHVQIPAGVAQIELEFQYLSPTDPSMGRIEVSREMIDLQWTSLAPYPASYVSRAMTVQADVQLPEGWAYATALQTDRIEGGTIHFAPVNYETFVDSPILAGPHHRSEPLGQIEGAEVSLDLFADRPELLQATPEQLAAHRALIEQTARLFRSRHFERYHFLVGLTGTIGSLGAEHMQSSENFTVPDYFTGWADAAPSRELLPHELVHSWNGKFRRGADLLTPTLDVPMQNSLLWVYEGLTRYLGAVLAVRSGLHSFDEALGNFAQSAAAMQYRTGRQWRPLRDTTNHSIYAEGPQPWPSWQRGSDYYLEGQLIWLDVDTLLRERTSGRHTLDDFVRALFAVQDRSQVPLAYELEDVVAALQTLAPHDWAGFFNTRVEQVASDAPLDGLQRGGYQLVYREQPTTFFRSGERQRKVTDLSIPLGLVVKDDGTVADVRWESPAFDAALTIGTRILAVNGRTYDREVLVRAVGRCKGRPEPLRLTVQRGDSIQDRDVVCASGLRYPWLERKESPRGQRERTAASLEAIFAPLTR